MEGKHKCPVCGMFEFEYYNSLEICDICGWQDDAVQGNDPDYEGGANRCSLNQSVELFKKSGVCKSWKRSIKTI